MVRGFDVVLSRSKSRLVLGMVVATSSLSLEMSFSKPENPESASASDQTDHADSIVKDRCPSFVSESASIMLHH